MQNKRVFVWYIMLNKRLIKRWSFVLVLLVAPLMVLLMNALSGGSKGVLRIALYQENDSKVSTHIINELLERKSIIQYKEVGSYSEGKHMVASGETDALWIFDEDIEERLSESASSHSINPVVKVVQREDTIALTMAREKLFSVVYPYLNYNIYLDFVNEDILGNETMSDEELLNYFEDNKIQDKLFQRKYLNGQVADSDSNYLLAPIRGMLAVWLVLCGLISCIYYMLDKRKGIFDKISSKHGVLIEAGYHTVIISIAAVIMLAGLVLSGTATTIFNETICLLAFIYATVAYCCLIRNLCRKPQVMGIIIPFLVIMMLGLSSAFISLKIFSKFRFLHPVYLYIMSIHSFDSLIELLLFGTVLYIICFFIKCSHFFDKSNI